MNVNKASNQGIAKDGKANTGRRILHIERMRIATKEHEHDIVQKRDTLFHDIRVYIA